MTELESEIDTLRTLDSLRVDSGRLRDEGTEALIALLEQDSQQGSSLFCMNDITDTRSFIGKLRSDANPATRKVSEFVWGQVPQTTRDLLNYSAFPFPRQASVLIHNLKDKSKKISEQIRGLLHPVKNFLSFVLDRELTAAAGGSGSYGEWDVVEMACAAAGYGAVTNEWGNDRLHRVVDCLNKVISDSGRFPIGRPFHRNDQGGYAMPYHTDVIEPLAQIFKEMGVRALRLKQLTAVPVEPLLVRKILAFFSVTRADFTIAQETTENGENKGWCLDYMPEPCPTDPNVTPSAVQSLALINRMLDEQINARILYHFSVKQPDKLETDLDTLYYPDYGISQAAPPELHRDSVATSLQKMRAHVGGLRDPDTLYSIVLHGPQGTGKTTIAEALASSCEVPLVEVTPSDIVLGGGEAVERRAPTVFEALSFLTRVVILFDEFDPVVWKREPEGGRPSDVFSFLTASMLPKLKTLHKTAKIRSVAYILITNLIGSLDEATIRKGAI